MLIQLLSNEPKRLIQLVQASSQKDRVVLLQNGIYAAQAILSECPGIACYALQDDYLASGLRLKESDPKSTLKLITAQQWVELCGLNSPIVTLQ